MKLNLKLKQEFVLGILGSVLLGVHTVIAFSPFASIYFLATSLICLFLLVLPALKDLRPIIIFLIILAFPEYGPDPYEDNFFSPFYFQKYILALYLLFCFSPKLTLNSILLIAILLLSWFGSNFYGINGNIFVEIFPLLLFFSFLFFSLESSKVDIPLFLISFTAFLFLSSLVIDISGVVSQRMAARNLFNVYLFGHYWGILVGYFILKFSTLKLSSISKNTLLLFFLLSLIFNINSFQSIHFLFILLCLAIRFQIFRRIRLSSIAITTSILFAFYIFIPYILDLSADGEAAWAIMKVKQAASLLTLNPTLFGNSVLIRINEILSLYQQSDIIQILFGRGFSSVYEMQGALWHLTNVHEFSFPLEQLQSGNLQTVHETLFLLLKWIGIAGSLLFIICVYNKFLKYPLKFDDVFFNLSLILLFSLSGVHTGILCFFLIRHYHKNE